MEKHDQGNLQNRAFDLGFTVPEGIRVYARHGGEHGSRNGARAVAESSHRIHKLEAVIQLVWH